MTHFYLSEGERRKWKRAAAPAQTKNRQTQLQQGGSLSNTSLNNLKSAISVCVIRGSCSAALESCWNVIIWFENKIWWKVQIKAFISWLFQQLVWDHWKQKLQRNDCCVYVFIFAAKCWRPKCLFLFPPSLCPRFALQIMRASLCCVWRLAIARILCSDRWWWWWWYKQLKQKLS